MRPKLAVIGAVFVAVLVTAVPASAWTVTMTANPHLKRTYHWTITKSVDKPAVTLAPGTTTDLTYTVTVATTGYTDSDWGVSGHVTMSEAPFEPSPPIVAALAVTIQPDALMAPVACVPSPFPVDLGGTSLECDYASPLPDASGPRDAWMRAQQVNGNFRNAHTPFDFTNPAVEQVDESVTVTDSMAGTLGTVDAATGSKTFTYTKTIGPYWLADCGSDEITNTAVFTTNDSGTTGSASADVMIDLPCLGKTFSIGPSSMEGRLLISPGDFVNGGYSFKFKKNTHLATMFTVDAKVAVPVTCPYGGGPDGTIMVNLGSRTYSVPAGNTNWLPTGDANSILSWMGATVAPDLCGGQKMENKKGAIYTATVLQSPASGSLVDFRFKYRDPAAKGKPNTNCTVPGPNRDKADVCGASWSQTVTDP